VEVFDDFVAQLAVFLLDAAVDLGLGDGQHEIETVVEEDGFLEQGLVASLLDSLLELSLLLDIVQYTDGLLLGPRTPERSLPDGGDIQHWLMRVFLQHPIDDEISTIPNLWGLSEFIYLHQSIPSNTFS
jgi:hypothetical protein